MLRVIPALRARCYKELGRLLAIQSLSANILIDLNRL